MTRRHPWLFRRVALAVLLAGLTTALVAALTAPELQAATTGTVVGQVTDAVSGEPLTGVNIALEGTKLTTVTGSKGFFSITNVPPGKHAINASLIGYAPSRVSDINVAMDLQARVEVKLNPTVEEEPETVVVEDKQLTNPDATQTLYMRTGQDQVITKAAPNSLYQVPSIVTTVPGVMADASGNIHIRGGREDEVGWMMEGIPVVNPIDNTFGTNLVTVGMSRMEVYTRGYQAEYGNAISGVLNEIKRTGSETRGSNVEMGLGDTGHTGVYLEAGNVTPSGVDWYFGNYSWDSKFQRYVASSADSSDSVLKVSVPAGKKDTVTFLGTGGSAEYRLPEVTPAAYPDQARTNQFYHLAGLTWSHQISPDAHWLLRPYYFLSKNNIRALSTNLGDSADSRSIQRGLQFELVKRYGEKHQVSAGIWNINGSNRFYRYIPDLAMRMTGDAETAALLDPFEYTSLVATSQLAIFAQDKMRISDVWGLDLGLRYDRMRYDKAVADDSSDSQVSPRIGLVWSTDPRTVVRASFGRFIQFSPTSVMDRQYSNANWEQIYAADAALKPERATSLEVSWERQVRSDTLLRVTPFMRHYTDLLDRVALDPSDPSSPQTFVNTAKANARGLECYLERRLGKGLRGWVSYTYTRTRQPDPYVAGGWTWVDWDQRHTLDATLLRTLGKTDYALRAQYGSGLPWTSQLDASGNGHRMPDTLVLSLGISRPVGSSPRDGSIGFNIYNLFNTVRPTSRDISGEPSTWVMPRYLSISFTRKI